MINVEKVEPSGIFTNYIFKAIPLAFDESMSYYETLAGLLGYLQQTILPAINNNADALAEVQNLMTQLQEYVDNYFTNLDVQEEINNKLDAMAQDGTLTNLIRNYIDPLIAEQNANINVINNKVDALASGSPLVASSTDDMTDTTKTYVNTTNGYWYYYDGTTWQQGGVYQSSGIADGSINILKFDDNLQSNFNIELSENLCPESGLTEYYTENTNHTVRTTSNTGYQSFQYSLEVGKQYFITGFNRYLAGAFLIVKNSEVIYNSLGDDTSGVTGASYIIQPNENGLTLYVNRVKSDPTNNNNFNNYYLTFIQTIDNIYNNLKIKSNIEKLVTVPNTYVNQNSSVDSICTFSVLNNYNMDVYQLNKGLTYKISSINRFNISGLVLTDKNYVLKYTSWESYASTDEDINYTFTAEYDGFIIVPNITTASPYVATVEIEYQTIEVTTITDNLYGKTVLWNGDSIGAGNGDSNKGYAYYISQKYSMTSTNYAVSGRCIAKEDGETAIIDTIPNMSSTADYVMFEGGWNDMWRVPLGEISEGFDAELDEYTWSGALESLIKQSKLKWPTARIGFILAHGKANNESEINRQNRYWDRAIEVFNKWHLPYIDLRHNGLVAFNNTLLDMFFKINSETGHGDGAHPNALGYKTFYNIPIASFMNRL